MKCLLLNSPIYRERSEVNEEYLPPLGLGYIATHLNKSNVEVKIIDCVKDRLGIDELFDELKNQQPEYVGINIFTQNYEIVKEIVENCPIKAIIIIGGQVVKCIFEELLQWDIQNKLVLIIGEGELIMPALINNTCLEAPAVKVGKKSLYRVDKNSHYFPRELDTVHIDRTLLNGDIITNHYSQKEASIITSRGCMYNCAFCGGAHNLNRDVTIRYRSISHIENEISGIISNNPEVTSIRILDDLFLRDQKSINSAIALFKRFDGLSWRGMAHILTFTKSLESLPLLEESGCREMFVGIESGSEIIRKRINKPGTVKQVIDVVSAILEAGIDVKGYFMFGFPNEMDSEANETYLLASKLKEISESTKGNFRASVFQFRPYHGTQLYNGILESGRKILPVRSNIDLNIVDGRSQFNFQSGNYSNIDDKSLNEYILKTQTITEESNV